MFGSCNHKIVKSDDGSFTAYSKEFEEHYHSTKDGALKESIYKHVSPVLKHTADKNEITILDICFGLGFNSLGTLYALKREGVKKKVTIHSPEFDKALIKSLSNFSYPEEFDDFKDIIKAVSENQKYESEDINIYIHITDAREFVKNTEIKFDIVYQDAFSPQNNPLLWTSEYFKDISSLMKEDAILSTYSTSLPTRIALYENGLNVYTKKSDGIRSSTLASKKFLKEYKKVDVLHKMSCNLDVSSFKDFMF